MTRKRVENKEGSLGHPRYVFAGHQNSVRSETYHKQFYSNPDIPGRRNRASMQTLLVAFNCESHNGLHDLELHFDDHWWSLVSRLHIGSLIKTNQGKRGLMIALFSLSVGRVVFLPLCMSMILTFLQISSNDGTALTKIPSGLVI
ncbi:hypothetical protein TNCV_4857941 [Trichonephila clavipes]|nr:hypothetical protein TNCV_4857941 [Trichonephila clavipes]